MEKNHPLIDNYKTEVFVYGIRDPDIKLAVCSTLKGPLCTVAAMFLAKRPPERFVEENHSLIDNYKTEVFVYGIWSPDIKLAVYFTQFTVYGTLTLN